MGPLEPSPARERTVSLQGVEAQCLLGVLLGRCKAPKPPQRLGVSPTIGQRAMSDSLLAVPAGARVSELDRLRCGPVRVSLSR
ncbi:hypothetical protein ACWDRB_19405 [Nonomuraea sp. NPDC003707]